MKSLPTVLNLAAHVLTLERYREEDQHGLTCKFVKRSIFYMYNWVTLLSSRNWHNTVYQRHFNKLKKNVAILGLKKKRLFTGV